MATPTQDYLATRLTTPGKLTQGLDAVVDGWGGAVRRRWGICGGLLGEAMRIEQRASRYEHLSDRLLRRRLETCRDVARRSMGLEGELLFEAFAAIREAAARRLGLRPFPVQLAGALALHRGYLVEMATGEGKTLVAGIAAVVAGWVNRPCHVITVNDYLAGRDAEWMRPIYLFCGVRVGHIEGSMDPGARAEAYAKDVTYCTGKELVADLLRDRLQLGGLHDPTRRAIRHLLLPRLRDRARLVLRGLHTAIADEADSVMIDEAVTPVIISSPRENEPLTQACRTAATLVRELVPGTHFTINTRYREVELLPEGEDRIECQCEQLPGLWRGPARRTEVIRQALTARAFYHRDKQYVIQDGKIVIVDESTGRLMPQRTWREGLHQAVEAQEQVEISNPSETLARLSFQRFFRLFARVSGMTGTAMEAADEFWHIYRLPVVRIPPNKPCARVEMPDRVFLDRAAKWDAVVEEIQRIHREGRPLLVGTRTVQVSEMLSRRLDALELPHHVLNAVRHREEAQIVAGAGVEGCITIATNMAGRGTDIKLARGVDERGGLHVLATERNESRRIDRQLFGRSGRQGDPGSAQAFVSLEDELIVRYTPKPIARSLGRILGQSETRAQSFAALVFGRAQAGARRLARKQRRGVLQLDTWLEEAIAFAGPDHV